MLTVTNTIDLLLWTLMVHLWSQWQRMLLMNRWLPWDDRQWGSLFRLIADRQVSSVSVLTRWLGTRLSIRCRVRKNRLPPVYITIISWHTYIRHLTSDILSILALAWQLTPNEVITLKVKVITLKAIALSDHIKLFWKEKYFVRKHSLLCLRKAGNLI